MVRWDASLDERKIGFLGRFRSMPAILGADFSLGMDFSLLARIISALVFQGLVMRSLARAPISIRSLLLLSIAVTRMPVAAAQEGATQPQPGSAPAASAAPEPWFLMSSLKDSQLGCWLEKRQIEVSGWTDLSFTASSDRSTNLPLGFNYVANDFLLQQNWLRVDRPVDTGSTTEPSYGFRFDTILPGSDYRFTIARGLFSGQLTDNNGQPARYGIDPIQFYSESYFPTVAQGLDVKVGHFFALIGVEANDSPSNALFSHSYTFLYDPFTHTGLLTTTKLSDAWTVQAGLVTGSDVFIDPADTPTFIGNFKWTSADHNDTVTANVILGSARFNQSRHFHNPDVFDLVYTHKFSDKLSYTLNALFGFTTDVPQIGTAEWFGIVNYVTYEFDSRLSATTRLEFFDDVDGERTGFAGLYTALTTGVSYRPWRWLTVRPELRYDNNSNSRPFEDKHNLFTAAIDMIVRW